jgi:GntR family transcriptional regulator, transcriptional repressor for pyruvate dehydrogenase complex
MAAAVQAPVPLPRVSEADRAVRHRGVRAASPTPPTPSAPSAPSAAAVSAEDLIRVQVMATRAAGQRITGTALEHLLDSVDRACGQPARPGWERKAAAHAEIFGLLVEVAGGPAMAARYGGRVRLLGELMCTVGPVADGMITSSRRRLLSRLRARDAEGAALEMENHLRALHYMGRLAAGRDARSS